MMKKGQAAMEFLMTYGWAILVVLAAIGALAYFGVLSPDKFLPEKCVLEPGVDCTGFKVTPTEVTLVLRNGKGQDMNITNLQVGSCSQAFTENSVSNGEMTTLVISGCETGSSGDRYNGEIIVSYVEKNSGLAKDMRGSLATRVQ